MIRDVRPDCWEGLDIPSRITTPDALAEYWERCGLLMAIALPVASFSSANSWRYIARAHRFAAFGAESTRNTRKLSNAWRTLTRRIEEKAQAEKDAEERSPCRVIGGPSLTTIVAQRLFELFLLFPDAPAAQPYAAIYGRRAVYKQHEMPDSSGRHGYTLAREISPAEERQTYREHADTDGATLKKIYRGRIMKHLLADARATGGEVHDLAIRYRQKCGDFDSSVPLLRELLLAVKPEAKSPTSHTKAEAGAMTNYRIQLAELNRFLDKPAPAVIAFLANINCPTAPVDRDAIRKAWQRRSDNKA